MHNGVMWGRKLVSTTVDTLQFAFGAILWSGTAEGTQSLGELAMAKADAPTDVATAGELLVEPAAGNAWHARTDQATKPMKPKRPTSQ
eukprot:3043695-Amphidinium_carterae.1